MKHPSFSNITGTGLTQIILYDTQCRIIHELSLHLALVRKSYGSEIISNFVDILA
ncbi:MAG: hypothetical protein F6J86_34690 [Symploca sp. SIO1B1]|nr:hypothetical protein [Symploca sp. SIO1B1]